MVFFIQFCHVCRLKVQLSCRRLKTILICHFADEVLVNTVNKCCQRIQQLIKKISAFLQPGFLEKMQLINYQT